MRRPLALIGAAALTLAAAPAGLSLQDGRMRAITPDVPAGGYFTLRNDGAAPVTLVGASSPACRALMLHETTHGSSQDGLPGMTGMNMVSAVAVPAHGALRFAPGGYHLMCLHPAAALFGTGPVPVTLRFADGATLTAAFAVQGPRRR